MSKKSRKARPRLWTWITFAGLLVSLGAASGCSTTGAPLSAKEDALRKSVASSPIPVFRPGDPALARQFEPIFQVRTPAARAGLRHPRFFAFDQAMTGFDYDVSRQEMWSWALGPAWAAGDGTLHVPLHRKGGVQRVLVAGKLNVKRRYGASGKACYPTTVAMPQLPGIDAERAKQMIKEKSLRVRYFLDLETLKPSPWDSFQVDEARCDLDPYVFFGEKRLLYIDTARVVAAVWYDPTDPSAFWFDVPDEASEMFSCDAGSCVLQPAR